MFYQWHRDWETGDYVRCTDGKRISEIELASECICKKHFGMFADKPISAITDGPWHMVGCCRYRRYE